MGMVDMIPFLILSIRTLFVFFFPYNRPPALLPHVILQLVLMLTIKPLHVA